MPGVFISRGMTVAIPAGGLSLSLGTDGKLNSSISLHVHFDVCPTWLGLAIGHLKETLQRRDACIAAWAGTDEAAKGSALEAEFETAMQAVMSAAVAIDAFYATIQNKIDIPKSLIEGWRKKKTARYAQVAEVMRLAFGLKSKDVKALRQNLRELYRLRDLAVHPSGKLDAPLIHPELNVGMEWRFVYFRYSNVLALVGVSIQTISELVTHGNPKNKSVQEYAAALGAIDPIVKSFEAVKGQS